MVIKVVIEENKNNLYWYFEYNGQTFPEAIIRNTFEKFNTLGKDNVHFGRYLEEYNGLAFRRVFPDDKIIKLSKAN